MQPWDFLMCKLYEPLLKQDRPGCTGMVARSAIQGLRQGQQVWDL